ncbi:MAG: tetraprenyl-beta-curcumene synthase family protein [Bacillota bacterium]|nr:tetraprenyl-beta-curcumene synthase family protein [Bacillota bacterium]
MNTKYKKGTPLIAKFVYRVFPEVNKEISKITEKCISSKDKTLTKLALSSLENKKFHAQGGSIYALYPKAPVYDTVKFIVSLQTISDYLDNLCDSAGIYDETAFRQLHLAMLDAVSPDSALNDYYKFYPFKEDNGYLNSLVLQCKRRIRKLPSYSLIKDYIIEYVKLYSDLQSLKHLKRDDREKRLVDWSQKYLQGYNGISWWEFAAAAGSTLGIFILFASAWDPDLTEVDVHNIDLAYFPWICGLHILLDYYIDYMEDIRTDELNFTGYYNNLKECEERLTFFINQSYTNSANLRYPEFHLTVIKGLLAMYLSDPKADIGLNKLTSRSILTKTGGRKTVFYHNLCKLLRLTGAL